MKKMESENSAVRESSLMDSFNGLSGDDSGTPDGSRVPLGRPLDECLALVGRDSSSDMEKERNFYRAKCRRLTCERDKLVRTYYSYRTKYVCPR